MAKSFRVFFSKNRVFNCFLHLRGRKNTGKSTHTYIIYARAGGGEGPRPRDGDAGFQPEGAVLEKIFGERDRDVGQFLGKKLDRRDRILQEPQDFLSLLFCSCSTCLYFRKTGERGSGIVNGERERDVGQFLEKKLDSRDRILQELQDLLSLLFCSCCSCLYFRKTGERGSGIVNGERERDVGQFLEKNCSSWSLQVYS